MRSQKQVRRTGKVHLMKNAASGKHRVYRKRLEAKKAWQRNCVFSESHRNINSIFAPFLSAHRKVKQPKQRSPEKLAERQRMREQRRLEKKSRIRKAVFSQLPKFKNLKEKKRLSSRGAIKKVSAKRKKSTNALKEGIKVKINVPTQEMARLKANDQKKAKKLVDLGNKLSQKHPLRNEKDAQKSKTVPLSKKMKQIESIQPRKTTAKKQKEVMDHSDGTHVDPCRSTSKEKKTKQKENMGDTHGMSKEEEKAVTEKVANLELEECSLKSAFKKSGENVAFSASDKNLALERSQFKAETAADNVELPSKVISKNSEVISTTKSSCDISNSKELQVSSANSIKEGVKPANHANLVLSTAVTESITSTTNTKAGKDGNMDVEKREPVLSLQEERLKYVQPVRERVYKLLPRDIQFCVHMIEKYGENYEGMAKDEGNIYHDSAKGIAQKIRIFKRSPEYAVYLKQQAEQKDSVA